MRLRTVNRPDPQRREQVAVRPAPLTCARSAPGGCRAPGAGRPRARRASAARRPSRTASWSESGARRSRRPATVRGSPRAQVELVVGRGGARSRRGRRRAGRNGSPVHTSSTGHAARRRRAVIRDRSRRTTPARCRRTLASARSPVRDSSVPATGSGLTRVTDRSRGGRQPLGHADADRAADRVVDDDRAVRQPAGSRPGAGPGRRRPARSRRGVADTGPGKGRDPVARTTSHPSARAAVTAPASTSTPRATSTPRRAHSGGQPVGDAAAAAPARGRPRPPARAPPSRRRFARPPGPAGRRRPAPGRIPARPDRRRR